MVKNIFFKLGNLNYGFNLFVLANKNKQGLRFNSKTWIFKYNYRRMKYNKIIYME